MHGKGSLVNRMPGDDWQRLANLRLLYTYLYTHPGKKLLFMGGEFAQWREWSHDGELDWDLLSYERHQGVRHLVRDLNSLYRSIPELHEIDCEGRGFEWIDFNNWENSVIAYLRRGTSAGAVTLVVCNFTPVPRHHYLVGVPAAGYWQEIFNSDAGIYGGGNVGNHGGVAGRNRSYLGKNHSLKLTLPPLGAIILRNVETIEAAPNAELP